MSTVVHGRTADGIGRRVLPRRRSNARLPGITDTAPATTTVASIDTYHGQFMKLVPDERVVEVFEFETADPVLAGAMTMTTTLTDAGRGTDVLVEHEGIPEAVPSADNETGTRMALEKLGQLVEAQGRS